MTEDEIVRQEFAKAFDWHEYEPSYGYSDRKKKYRIPTWGEIFVELGKVLERGKIEVRGEPIETL